MALATCELICLRHLIQELRFGKNEQMKLICNNQAALHIASNSVFHERTKHIEVDCHFFREKIASRCMITSFVNLSDQLANVFTKSLRGPRIKHICNKLGAFDLYPPALRGVLRIIEYSLDIFLFISYLCIHYPPSFYILFCFPFVPFIWIYIYIYIYIYRCLYTM